MKTGVRMKYLNDAWQSLQLITVMDIIDVLIVAVLVYKLLRVIRHTNAEKLFKGIVVVLVATMLANAAELNEISFLLNQLMVIGPTAIVIIFQPELRKMLEQFGRSRRPFFHRANEGDPQTLQLAIMRTTEAVGSMAWSKTGALIIFERSESLDEITRTGSIIDAEVNAELLKNIFFNKAPLHDGAVVISGGRIKAAGCLLPLSSNLNISKELGTRHRAAVGMSEHSDALCVVVSEETGSISLAEGGMLKRHLAVETLERLLINGMMPATEETKKPSGGLLSKIRGMKKSWNGSKNTMW